MYKILLSLLFLVSIVLSNPAYSQIERKKATKTCEGCKWREGDTYYYMKPNGKVVFDTELKRHRFSYETDKDYWSFVYLADPKTGKWKGLLNFRTTEFFIDLRGKEDGYFDDLTAYYKYDEKFPDRKRSTGIFFTVYYDGGSTLVDTNMNVIIPFLEGQTLFANNGSGFNVADIPTEGMVDENDWAFMAWPSKRRFKLNGEETSPDNTTNEVLMELPKGYTYRKDLKLYSPSGKEMKKIFFKPYKTVEFPEIKRLLIIMNADAETYIINTETEELIVQEDLSFDEPELMLERYVYAGNWTVKTILDLVTGKRMGESYDKLVFKDGKFFTASNGTELNTEVDPTTGKTKNVGFENEKYAYKDIDVITPSKQEADQTLCLSYDGKIIRGHRNFYEGRIDLRTYAKDGSSYTTNYITISSDPHRMIPLKKGGYALAGRNHFSWLDTTLNVIKSAGTKMLDWRATNQSPNDYTYFMEDWKQNSGESTGTAVDFLDLSENTSSTIIASVFLYHQWTSSGAQEMRLGLAIRTMTEPSEFKIHDLNIVVDDKARFDGPQDIAEEVKISFIDENHVVIGFCGSKDGVSFQATVIDAKKIIDGQPLDAQVWQGNLKEMGSYDDAFAGLFAENGVLYYAMSGVMENMVVNVGKAKWDGSSLTVSLNKKVNAYDVGKPHVFSSLNKSSIILAGISNSTISSYSMQPYAIILDKTNFIAEDNQVLLKGDDFFDPQVVDAVSLDPNGTEKRFMLLFRGKSNDKGLFYMSEIKVK
jgi:hypothetical protein